MYSHMFITSCACMSTVTFLTYLYSTYKFLISLKGTATLMICMFYPKELYESCILIQVSSKSAEKWASNGHLKNSIWPTFSRHFEYSISFQNFSNCLIFRYHYYYIICVSADMQLIHKENELLKINANNPLVCLLF